ncbi:MAG: hypothetical protein ACOVNL_14185 [Prochlorococcaceae cyanobacterium]
MPIRVRAQGEEGITYARLLTKDDQRIRWADSALAVHRRVMGLYPGAFTLWRGRRLKVLTTEPLVRRLADQLSPEARELCALWSPDPGEEGQGTPASNQPETKPGTVLAVVNGVGLLVSTRGCPLLVREAQLEGKAACSGQSLLQQLDAAVGERFGDAEEWDACVS